MIAGHSFVISPTQQPLSTQDATRCEGKLELTTLVCDKDVYAEGQRNTSFDASQEAKSALFTGSGAPPQAVVEENTTHGNDARTGTKTNSPLVIRTTSGTDLSDHIVGGKQTETDRLLQQLQETIKRRPTLLTLVKNYADRGFDFTKTFPDSIFAGFLGMDPMDCFSEMIRRFKGQLNRSFADAKSAEYLYQLKDEGINLKADFCTFLGGLLPVMEYDRQYAKNLEEEARLEVKKVLNRAKKQVPDKFKAEFEDVLKKIERELGSVSIPEIKLAPLSIDPIVFAINSLMESANQGRPVDMGFVDEIIENIVFKDLLRSINTHLYLRRNREEKKKQLEDEKKKQLEDEKKKQLGDEKGGQLEEMDSKQQDCEADQRSVFIALEKVMNFYSMDDVFLEILLKKSMMKIRRRADEVNREIQTSLQEKKEIEKTLRSLEQFPMNESIEDRINRTDELKSVRNVDLPAINEKIKKLEKKREPISLLLQLFNFIVIPDRKERQLRITSTVDTLRFDSVVFIRFMYGIAKKCGIDYHINLDSAVYEATKHHLMSLEDVVYSVRSVLEDFALYPRPWKVKDMEVAVSLLREKDKRDPPKDRELIQVVKALLYQLQFVNMTKKQKLPYTSVPQRVDSRVYGCHCNVTGCKKMMYYNNVEKYWSGWGFKTIKVAYSPVCWEHKEKLKLKIGKETPLDSDAFFVHNHFVWATFQVRYLLGSIFGMNFRDKFLPWISIKKTELSKEFIDSEARRAASMNDEKANEEARSSQATAVQSSHAEDMKMLAATTTCVSSSSSFADILKKSMSWADIDEEDTAAKAAAEAAEKAAAEAAEKAAAEAAAKAAAEAAAAAIGSLLVNVFKEVSERAAAKTCAAAIAEVEAAALEKATSAAVSAKMEAMCNASIYCRLDMTSNASLGIKSCVVFRGKHK
jgi:hypothetical protein